MEHALVVLKPDAIERQLEAELLGHFRRSGLKPLVRRRIPLSRRTVGQLFVCGEAGYADYMTGGPVEAWLLRATDANRRARRLKNKLRVHYGVVDRVENLVHSSEPGNEYDMQVAHFWGASAARRWSLYGDQLAYCGRLPLKIIETALGRVRSDTSVSSVVLVCSLERQSEIEELCQRARGGVPSVHYCLAIPVRGAVAGCETILAYPSQRVPGRLRLETGGSHVTLGMVGLANRIARQGWIPVLGQAKAPGELTASVLRELGSHGLFGAVCYTPEYRLLQTDELRTALYDAELECVGGSAGSLEWGRNGVSQAVFDELPLRAGSDSGALPTSPR